LHKRPNETYAEGDLARVDSEHHRIIWSPELESQSEFVRVRGCASYVTFNRTRYTSYCYIFGHVRKNDVLIGEKCNGGDYVD
jgi:hypothetical protein